jgi:hypothetical protein
MSVETAGLSTSIVNMRAAIIIPTTDRRDQSEGLYLEANRH